MRLRSVVILGSVWALTACCSTAPEGAHESFSRTILSDHTVTVHTIYSLNEDCTTREPVEVRITKQPEHGTVSVVQKKDYPGYATTNTHSSCNKKKVLARALEYTPAKGYTGKDTFEYEAFYQGISSSHNTAKLTIVK